MSKQIGFYVVDEDFALLLRFAEEVGLVAIPRRIETDSRVEAVRPTKLEPSRAAFYLIPKELPTAEAFYVERPTKENVSALDSYNSPVIECIRSECSGNQLSSGRIYLRTDRSSSLYPNVNQKYEALARRIKKWERVRGRNYYVGPETAELVRKNSVVLQYFNEELHLAEK
jgi:hypothetical protein